MAGTTLAKTGLVLSNLGETDWPQELRTGFQALEDRTGLTYSGDPNNHVAGSWYGQTCIDTAGGAVYFCVKPGNAATAQWFSTGEDPTPPGKVDWFFRDTLPTGWIPFDGTIRLKADYPRLYEVLPAAYKSGSTFTLPKVTEALAPIFGGTGAIGSIVGKASTENAGAQSAKNITADVPLNPADSGEIGYASSGYVNVGGGGTTVMQYIARILAQTLKIPAVNDHAHAFATRGMLFVAGVHF